jgi:hypothetical protein
MSKEGGMLLRTIVGVFVMLLTASVAGASDLQGMLADWNCVKPMVKQGRAKVLKRQPNCSLDKNYSREAYGIITDDKHYYKLDDTGRDWALKVLKGSGSKDNLHVVVSGTIQGDTVHVQSISEL